MVNASRVCYKYITWGHSHSWGRDRDRDIAKRFEYLHNLLLAGLPQKILSYLFVATCTEQYKISMWQTQTEKFILAGQPRGNACTEQALRYLIIFFCKWGVTAVKNSYEFLGSNMCKWGRRGNAFCGYDAGMHYHPGRTRPGWGPGARIILHYSEMWAHTLIFGKPGLHASVTLSSPSHLLSIGC